MLSEIITIFSDDYGIQFYTNSSSISRKFPRYLEINILPSSQGWSKKNCKRNFIISNGVIMISNLCDEHKAALTGKCIALETFNRKVEDIKAMI
jgi:hypothetical protein